MCNFNTHETDLPLWGYTLSDCSYTITCTCMDMYECRVLHVIMYIIAGIKDYNFIASKEKTLVNFDCGRPDVPQLSGTGSAYYCFEAQAALA